MNVVEYTVECSEQVHSLLEGYTAQLVLVMGLSLSGLLLSVLNL